MGKIYQVTERRTRLCLMSEFLGVDTIVPGSADANSNPQSSIVVHEPSFNAGLEWTASEYVPTEASIALVLSFGHAYHKGLQIGPRGLAAKGKALSWCSRRT